MKRLSPHVRHHPHRFARLTGRSTSSHTRRRGAFASLTAAVLTATMMLTACGQGNGAPSQAQPSAQASVTTTPLTKLEKELTDHAVSDPHTVKGPTTASSVPEVQPLEDPQKPQLPVTVTDEQGTQVKVADVSRILALDIYGTLADTVIGLGLGDRLVGRVTSSTASSLSSLPVVTEGGHDLNVEKILSLRPTLVLMDTTNGPREVTEQLRSAGVTVVHFSPDRSIDTVVPQIQQVAQALGVPESGKRLGERVQQELDSVQRAIASVAPQEADRRLSIAFLYVRGTAGVFFVLGQGSGADGLIKALSGVDAAGEAGVKDIKPATSEALATLNPDLILAMSKGVESAGGVDGLASRPGMGETTAGKNRRIVDMADGQILSFGPNAPAVLLSLARAIYAPDTTTSARPNP
ncbi:heme/hemin ABC transporter substrate-binding protein [Kocuria sp. HSID16901]|uniref:heme/hemin ABC transporter substrate-binding protein n=1 Tax=Kocuria sp. HSID16901 TaxID=2419505 RepID=UPI000A4AA8F3|nr:ABC transporter substrate-binding protein [Kocuria sp. HSID16901]MCT1368167.1 ABC transporter substrate-binding protein [Rothia sp. p3-SID1597]